MANFLRQDEEDHGETHRIYDFFAPGFTIHNSGFVLRTPSIF